MTQDAWEERRTDRHRQTDRQEFHGVVPQDSSGSHPDVVRQGQKGRGIKDTNE